MIVNARLESACAFDALRAAPPASRGTRAGLLSATAGRGNRVADGADLDLGVFFFSQGSKGET